MRSSMNECYLFANFGADDVRNGQVQKALALKKLFSSRFGFNFHPIDVSHNRKNLWQIFTQYESGSSFCVSLGRNGIRIFALVYLLTACIRFTQRPPKLFYFVVGGWIAQLATSSKLLLYFLKKVNAIFVETNGLAAELCMLGLNAIVFPNFRSKLYQQPKSLTNSPIRLCFCARIREDKGVFLAVDLAEKMRERGKQVILDFYGSIDSSVNAKFLAKLHDGVIQYKGSYKSEEEAVDIMRGYDFLILPTSYPGECMPGAIVEAFCAATPVVTSNWLYMPEIVRHGRDGLVIDLAEFSHAAAEQLIGLLDSGSYASFSRESLTVAKQMYSEAAAQQILNDTRDFN